MKRFDFSQLNRVERRRFLKLLGVALASPLVPAAVRNGAFDAIGQAHAQSASTPTYFIEINLRDQWDHGHLFVPPSLATFQNLRRGETGRRTALYFTPDEITERGNRQYLTPQSQVLEPHLDTIALIDTCEMSVGAIHGHESANALRSPGRSYSQSGGKTAMFNNDMPSNFPQGCEAFYSSTPTPATLHNYVQKQLNPTLRNGFAFKGISRSIHTAYHFAATLPGAELDRIQNKQQLFASFPDRVEDLNIVASEAEAEALTKLLNRVDSGFLDKRRYAQNAKDAHLSNLVETRGKLFVSNPRVISMPLTEEEVAYWSADVPDQVTNPATVKAQIWEQVAYAFKAIEGDLVRSISLEFDYVDVHDYRPPDQMRVMTLQVALPLARLIEQLKAAGIYDQTVIAIYTTDGGRAPASGSQGNEGKNGILLAGGRVRGGYFGDVGVAGDDGDGHRYFYEAPSIATGAPSGNRPTDNSGRLEGKHVWRTVAALSGIESALQTGFPDVADAQLLSWLIRS